MLLKTLLPLIVLFTFASCKTTVKNNTLTKTEVADGWKLLFDGKTMNNWRNYKKDGIGAGWVIDEESIHLNATKRDDDSWQVADGGDIITKDTYKNFELMLEWKIGACGNSGIIFNVKEDEKYNYVWQTGPEMQVLDNSCHPDAKYKTHRAGDLYDMIETSTIAVKKAGEWNKVVVKSQNSNVEFTLNDQKVVSFQMHTEEWKNRVANSKFKDMPGFGTFSEGHISLQDHGDKVWYRNVKIREL